MLFPPKLQSSCQVSLNFLFHKIQRFRMPECFQGGIRQHPAPAHNIFDRQTRNYKNRPPLTRIYGVRPTKVLTYLALCGTAYTLVRRRSINATQTISEDLDFYTDETLENKTAEDRILMKKNYFMAFTRFWDVVVVVTARNVLRERSVSPGTRERRRPASRNKKGKVDGNL